MAIHSRLLKEFQEKGYAFGLMLKKNEKQDFLVTLVSLIPKPSEITTDYLSFIAAYLDICRILEIPSFEKIRNFSSTEPNFYLLHFLLSADQAVSQRLVD